ncbi:TolC family protein [Comamonas sp. lk]|uniref:TolC family protein n=1 Tax=Comamonas sp. lk TaxID=2201272 RepID=UPI000EB46703|nr:TolC family protein [Comamonas sp. lk]
MKHLALKAAPLLAALVLAGCASVSPDGLRGNVAQLTEGRLPQGAQLPSVDTQAQQSAQTQIADWLQQPVDVDAAVRIALLNNPGLQAQLAQLGIADAQRVQVLTLPNPSFTFGRFRNGHEREIERQLSFGLVQLITLPWRSRWQGWQLEQATLTAAQQVLLLAADTRRAWLRAVAAEQALAAHERMHEAAAVGGELARRMAQVGNFSKMDQARELAQQQQAAAQLARVRLNAQLEREQLARRMGLWGQQLNFKLPDQLPAIPADSAALRSGEDAEATAMRQRLDLGALRRDLDVTAGRQGWATIGSIFGDIGASYSNNTSTERATGHSDKTQGWEFDVPLPLFDWGFAARGLARNQVLRSAALLRDNTIRARSEARSSWLSYRTAYDLAQQQQAEVLPLARLMQEETVYRYNGMFMSVWQLLTQARATTQAVVTATEAQRDFWLAETDLQLALTGTSPGTSPGTTAVIATSAAPAAAPEPGH